MAKRYVKFEKQGNISHRHKLPLTLILEIELFDIWGIDFMAPFVCLYGNKFILVDTNYVSNGWKQ